MRISYNWLKSLVSDLTLTPVELAELLTRHSFETVVRQEYGVPTGVITVKISKIAKHPNADRLQLATIIIGDQEITVVCGAPNIEVGQIVPYSAPGTALIDEEGKSFIVEERKIRGVMSKGMLNSLRELGLHHDHAGIWILPPDAPLGQEISQLISRDTILEADITPNRAHDCLSHVGVAREVAALLSLQMAEPNLVNLPETSSEVQGFKVKVEDHHLCPRYLGAVLSNLTPAPSPLWLQGRLLSAGGKPINSLIDVTNYVTFEYGNPAHLFDQDFLPDKTIRVRPAHSAETLTLLDEETRVLEPNDLVIASGDNTVALAGIMGGKKSGIQEKTSQGFLEVANFNAYRVQETSRRLGLRTESSVRFSKNLDPNIIELAARRALGLLREIAGAEVIGVIDNYPKPFKGHIIPFRFARVAEVAGSDVFTEHETKSILRRLRCDINDKTIPWRVVVPTDRLDLVGEHDLVEEIIRVTGLDKIVAKSPTTEKSTKLPAKVYWREVTREILAELGLTESYNYSFSAKGELALSNPPAPERKYLRDSLIPGLLANLDKNKDAFHRNPTGLFELGHVFYSGPIERINLAAVIVGRVPSLQDISQKLATALGLDHVVLKNIVIADNIRTLKYRLPVEGFEIDLDELLRGIEKPVPTTRSLQKIQAETITPSVFKQLPKYPSVFRDISVLVDNDVSVEAIQEVIERVGGMYVVDSELFDEYVPKEEENRGLAFHIEYRSATKTLTGDFVKELHNDIIDTLKNELDAEVR